MRVVVDFVKVKAALKAVTGKMEEADLNACEAFADGKPSAERVAKFFAEQLAEQLAATMAGHVRLYRLSVTEAPGCSAAFYP